MKLTIEHPHSLPEEEVKRRLEDLANRLAAKYHVEAKWASPTEATIKRTGVSGRITLSATKVVVSLDLTILLRPMRDRIDRRVRSELSQVLT